MAALSIVAVLIPNVLCGRSALLPASARLASHVTPRARVCAGADPFRSARPPIEPLAINALVKGLQAGAAADVDALLAETVARRAHDADSALSDGEAELLRAWITGVLANQSALLKALSGLAQAEPFLDLGVGKDDNPYVMLCRAECMLALHLLHVAAADEKRAVSFIDADRLEVLAAVRMD